MVPTSMVLPSCTSTIIPSSLNNRLFAISTFQEPGLTINRNLPLLTIVFNESLPLTAYTQTEPSGDTTFPVIRDSCMARNACNKITTETTAIKVATVLLITFSFLDHHQALHSSVYSFK